MAFVDVLHRWQAFFSLVGEATVSFAALLFVALSLNGERLLRDENRHLQLLAKQTFSNLLLIAVMAFLSLAPTVEQRTFGVALIVACSFGLVTALTALREEHYARGRARITREHMRAYYGPALIYVWLIASAYGIMRSTEALPFFAYGSVSLMMASARNAWLLLVGPARG